MSKKFLILFVWGVIIITLVGGCMYQTSKKSTTLGRDLKNYHDDSFFIQFNDQIKNGLKASIPNRDFQEYFNQDLELIISDIDEIEDINLDFHFDSNLVYIKIKYNPNLDNEKRYMILDSLVMSLEDKWYVKAINYDPYDKVIN